MSWQIYEGSPLFSNSKRKPILNENIQAEMIKFSISDRFPARIELALVHQAANKFGVTKNDQFETCACCDQRIGNIELPGNATLQRVNCPTGIILVFSFIKMTMFYMILHFAVTGLYNFYSNIKGGECGNPFYPELKTCNKKSSFLRFSPVNKLFQTQEFRMCSIFNLVFVIAAVIFFIIYRKIHYESHIRASAKNQTQDQYSLYLTNLPKILNNGSVIHQDDIRDCCQKIIDNWKKTNQQKQEKDQDEIYKDYIRAESLNSNNPQNRANIKGDVIYLHLCWDLSQIYEIIHNKNRLQDSVQTLAQRVIQSKNHRPSFQLAVKKFKQKMPFLKQQLNHVDGELLQLSREYSMQENRSPQFYITHFIGKSFIGFQYQHFAHVVRQEIVKGNTKINDNVIQAEWASHPRDIYWQNLTISPRIRRRREVVSLTILLGTVFFSFLGCMLVQYIGIVFKPRERIVIYGYGLFELIMPHSINLVVYFVNLVLFKVMNNLTEYEKHETRTYQQASLLWKSLVAQFINSALLFIIIHFVMKMNLWDDEGIVLSGGSQVYTGVIYDIIIKTINYGYFSKKFHLWWKYRNGPLEQPKIQSRLNKEFQWPQFDLADMYSGYITQIYISMFFSYFAPLSTFFTSVGFAIQYYLDKKILLRHSTVKKDYNFMMSREALKYLERSLIIFTAGNLLLEYLFFTISIYSLIALGISVIFLLLTLLVPFSKQMKLLSNEVNYQDISYAAAFNNGMFQHTFRNKDPSTRFTSRRMLGRIKDYCTLQDALKWLSQSHPDEAKPYPPFDPNSTVKAPIP